MNNPLIVFGSFFNVLFILTRGVYGFILPNCTEVEFFEVSSVNCRPCPVGAQMTASKDGLSCACQEHSVMMQSGRCRACNITEVISADGTSCVPRRCQASTGRVVCRKCPKDSIIVTQNHDGTLLKVVQCIKCAKGYRAEGNTCVRCESCVCSRNDVVVRGKCLPKQYVTDRPKYEENLLHPTELLDIVKNEYMCTIYNITACRWLASACVTNYYSSDPAGACRLWIYPNLVSQTILPLLSANNSNTAQSETREIHLSNGQRKLLITAISYDTVGNYQYHFDKRKKYFPCFPPIEIKIGEDLSHDCAVNILEVNKFYNKLVALYTGLEDSKKPVNILIRKPSGQLVQKGLWQSNKFLKYFLYQQKLSATSNITNMIYLRTLLIKLRVERNQNIMGSLKLNLNFEAQYAIISPSSDTFITSLKIINELPNAGILYGLEIWGSILTILMVLYALAQWRGVMRRGGHPISLLPLMAGCIADSLYFATWSTVVHALAAEAGILGLTLPLSAAEEDVIEAMIYTIVFLKILKVFYINWILCRYDIFVIDWSEYNSDLKDSPLCDEWNSNKSSILAREWAALQTKRRTSPAAIVILTLFTLHIMEPWRVLLPNCQGYRWALAVIAWWSSYIVVFLSQMIVNRLFGSPPRTFEKICSGVECSMLLFQEDLYAHYVHGCNDSSETKYLSGSLTTSRVVCAPQFRTICKQLLLSGQNTLERHKSIQLLSRFLAAFFERALDGLNWVASERTTLEKLFNMELSVREGGNTSILLYEMGNTTPSSFDVTWWGNEWTLVTFDSIIFCSIMFATKELLYAAFVTITLSQIMKIITTWLGNKNVRDKTNIRF